MPVVLPVLPQAERSMSHSRTRSPTSMRSAGMSAVLLAAASTLLNGVLKMTSTPFSASVFLHRCCNEPSNIGRKAGKASTSITLQPSFAKINEYSTPMMPEPCTTITFGILSMFQMVSESYTPGRLKSVGGNRFDFEPVAIIIASVSISDGSPPPVGRKRHLVVETTLPWPWSTETWKVRSSLEASCCALIAAHDRIAATSVQVLAPPSTASRRHLE
mmetsp:Transcript_32453/g.76233  ORF Transcript_32453/g.76233 Transcript_32453/m.76233 type:complete len:217 (+) Transcript_32453:936-1586(+)